MPLQSVPLSFAGGMAPDAPDMDRDGCSLVEGLAWVDGCYQLVRSPLIAGTQAAPVGAVTFAEQYRSLAGVDALYIATDSKLYYFNPNGGAITNLGAGFVSDNWKMCRFGDNVLACSQGNAVKQSAALAAFANVATSVLKPRGRFITTMKTHAFLAYVDDGAGGAFDSSKFWWSARNSSADWQPGSNRAGFANVRKDVGPITNVAGFEEFGVLFCERAVYRIDYVGGASVWSLRQIAGPGEGMPTNYHRSMVVVGTDIYYLSWTGPRVVRAGESVEILGTNTMRRWLTSPHLSANRGLPPPPDDSVTGGLLYNPWWPSGALDSGRPLIAWQYCYATYDPGTLTTAFGPPTTLLYNYFEDAFTVLPSVMGDINGGGGTLGAYLCGKSGQSMQAPSTAVPTLPGSGYWAVYTESSSGDLKVAHRAHASSTLAAKIVGRRWRPTPGATVQLCGLRPIARLTDWSGVASGTIVDKELTGATLRVEAGPDPRLLTVTYDKTTAWAANNMDENGFLIAPDLPIEANVFRFTLALADQADGGVNFAEFSGLEAVVNSTAALR
jgi:hypothetical protein